MKLDLKRWEYDGLPLAPPMVVAWRFIFIPFAQLFRALFVLCILFGWGVVEAKNAWKDTE